MLDLIRVFDQVVESGSFSQAGQALSMAPSSIARNIDALEAQLKTTLFKRSTRKLVLTEKGEYFHQQSLLLLENADQLVSEMKGANSKPEGLLRISAFESFGNIYLAPLIPAFLQRYPAVHIELELDNNLVDLNRDNIDLAIRIGTPKDSALRARHLLTNHTSLVAAPDYLARHPEIINPDDLQHHNCLLISHKRQRNHWWFRKGKSQKRVLVTGNLTSKGGSPLLCAALQGSGVLLLSDWMVNTYIDKQELVRVLPQWCATHSAQGSGDIFAIYKGSQYPKPHIRVFLDFLIEHLEQVFD